MTIFPFDKTKETGTKSNYRRYHESCYHNPIYVPEHNANRRECSKSQNYHEQEHKSKGNQYRHIPSFSPKIVKNFVIRKPITQIVAAS